MFREIVNFTVEDNPNRAVLIAHRLPASLRKVNNGKAAVSKPNWAIQVKSLTIRTTMAQGAGHFFENIFGWRSAIQLKNTSDPAHWITSSPSAVGRSGR